MKFTTIMNYFSLTSQQITSCFHTPHVTLVHSETFSFFFSFFLFTSFFIIFFKSKEKAHLTCKQSQKDSVSMTGIFLELQPFLVQI